MEAPKNSNPGQGGPPAVVTNDWLKMEVPFKNKTYMVNFHLLFSISL